jgi:hypothetical protein
MPRGGWRLRVVDPQRWGEMQKNNPGQSPRQEQQNLSSLACTHVIVKAMVTGSCGILELLLASLLV